MTRRTWSAGTIAGTGLLAVAGARLAIELWRVLTGPISYLTSRIHDDGWYYLVIARSLAGGQGPSFAAGEATNGYQPLWQGVLAASAAANHGTAAARASLLLGGAFTLTAFALLLAVVHRIRPISLLGAGAVAVVVTSPPVWNRVVNGMEAPAVLLALAVVIVAADRWWRRPGLGPAALLGACCGLLVLGRLTGAALIWLIPLGLAAARRPSRPLRQGAVWAVALLIVVAPWALWSWAETGAWRPVTLQVKGAIEEQTSGPLLSTGRLSAFGDAISEEVNAQVDATVPGARHVSSPLHQVIAVASIAAGIALAVLALRRRPRLLVVALPVGAASARVAIDVVLLPSSIPEWYGAVLVVPAALGLLAGLEVLRSAARSRWREAPTPAWAAVAGGAVLTVGALALATAPDGRGSGTWEQADREAALALDRFGPADRAGAFDAGVVGFFAPGTRNLDGLVRGPEYVDRIADGFPTADDVLAEPIDLLVHRTEPGDQRVPTCARALWRSPTEVQLGQAEPVPVTIWDLRPCRPG